MIPTVSLLGHPLENAPHPVVKIGLDCLVPDFEDITAGKPALAGDNKAMPKPDGIVANLIAIGSILWRGEVAVAANYLHVFENLERSSDHMGLVAEGCLLGNIVDLSAPSRYCRENRPVIPRVANAFFLFDE
jgi:hypothetical protein